MVLGSTQPLTGMSKVHPRTGHEGPEGEQMYSSTLPSTSALYGGGWSTSRPGRFTPGKDPVPVVTGMSTRVSLGGRGVKAAGA